MCHLMLSCTYFDTVSDDFQHRFHGKHSSKPHIRILEDIRVEVVLIIVLPVCDRVSGKPNKNTFMLLDIK